MERGPNRERCPHTHLTITQYSSKIMTNIPVNLRLINNNINAPIIGDSLLQKAQNQCDKKVSTVVCHLMLCYALICYVMY